MTLLGKIFTVLILVMSLVFSGFAVAVFAMHKNWRDVVVGDTGLKKQLTDERTKAEAQKEVQRKVEESLAVERNDKQQQVAKLESERNSVKQEAERLSTAQAEQQKKVSDSMAAMQAAQKQLEGLRDEVVKLRGEISKSLAERDEYAKKVVGITDEMHAAVSEVKRLKDRNLALAADLEKARSLMRLFDLDENKDYSGKAPKVNGLVLAVEGNDLVEVSIGSDDGLMKGHKLEVYRTEGGASTYLGRIDIIRTQPDRAVGKVDMNFRKGTIQKGDRVASTLD